MIKEYLTRKFRSLQALIKRFIEELRRLYNESDSYTFDAYENITNLRD